MPQLKRTPNFYRRRTGWNGFLPTWDSTGLWLQLKWLWYSWDYFPAPFAKSFGTQVDDLRNRGPSGP